MSAEIGEDQGREGTPTSGANHAIDRATPKLSAETSNPRAALLADLAARLADMTAVGDLEGARLIHETIGRLLSAPLPTVAKVTPFRAAKKR